MPPKAEDRPTVPPVWIDASLEAGTILAHVSQSTIHTIALSATAWCQTGQSEAQRVIFNHYVICNDTNEALRFGQVRKEWVRNDGLLMLLLLATFTTVEIRFEFWNNDFYGAEKGVSSEEVLVH